MLDMEKLVPITDFIVIVFEILVTIGLTIFVHELGHFLAAKRMGVKVEKFAIGWGPKIVSFKYRETEYLIALFSGVTARWREKPLKRRRRPAREDSLIKPRFRRYLYRFREW
jgi:hypothetical protein